MDNTIIDMKEEMIPGCNVVFMRRVGKYGYENKLLMERFKNWIKEKGRYTDECVVLGIARDDVSVVRSEDCRYDVCMIATDDFRVARDIDVQYGLQSGGKYITIRIAHTAEAMQYMWSEGLKRVSELYSIDFDRAIMERYKKKFVDMGYCEFCIPIN